jgi:hypothetical protein
VKSPSRLLEKPIAITFTWPDANNDGKVDGTSDMEKNLYMYKNGKKIAGPCKSDLNCDMDANKYTVYVSSLSFFVIGGTFNNTITSVSSNDGWTLESKETSNLAGSMSKTGPLRVGDDPLKRQYRSILYFDTSGIPNKADITKATLKIHKAAPDVKFEPFIAMDNLIADIKQGCFGLCPLQLIDFSVAANPGNLGKFTDAGSGWYQLNINPRYLKYVNVFGATQFRLRFKLDDNNDKFANYVMFDSGGDTNAPQFIVEYTAP